MIDHSETRRDLAFNPAFSAQVAQLASRLRREHHPLPDLRGEPIALDPHWHRAIRRLTMLGQTRRTRPYVPAPANDRGHRHSRSRSEDNLTFRLAAAVGVALVSSLILATMGLATFDPQFLLTLLS